MEATSSLSTLYMLLFVLSILVDAGCIGFVFKYGIRLAVAESEVENLKLLKPKQENIDNRLVLVEDAVKKFEKSAEELSRLPSIEGMLRQMKELLEKQVPRPEMEVRFVDFNRRLESLEKGSAASQ